MPHGLIYINSSYFSHQLTAPSTSTYIQLDPTSLAEQVDNSCRWTNHSLSTKRWPHIAQDGPMCTQGEVMVWGLSSWLVTNEYMMLKLDQKYDHGGGYRPAAGEQGGGRVVRQYKVSEA